MKTALIIGENGIGKATTLQLTAIEVHIVGVTNKLNEAKVEIEK
jgi:predicted ATPase